MWDLRVFGAVGRLSFVGSIHRNRGTAEPTDHPALAQTPAAQAWAARR